ncbi:hypothetical protein ACX0HA_06630 [Flavobacterium hauense]
MKSNILLMASALVIFTSCQKKEEKTETVIEETKIEKPSKEELAENEELCFSQIVNKDTLILTVIKNGENISGTYKSIPFEKDKKTTIFKGRIVGNTVTAVGTAMAEGQTSQEEIIFTLENNKAGIKFGEMIEGDDGVYRYKNIKNTSSLFVNKADCPK